MSEKMDETVYLNSCDILIDSINLKSIGTYYLVWKKGKKHTQSNKYQLSSDQTYFPREILSLSLKIYQQGTTILPRHTHLILYNGNNEQIDRIRIMIHEWTTDFKQMMFNIGGGSVKLKVKRKNLMKLQKFHRLRSQVEETSDDQRTRFSKKMFKQNTNDKDEIIKLTKDIEDMNFLVDRLKQERNLGLVKIEKLETELGSVNDKMKKDLAKLRQYYHLKIQMRESVFKEQIQQLITSFNKNYELNYSIMENLIKQKIQLQKEIVDLNESNQEYIAQQQQNFARIMDEMQNHKQLIDAELKDSNQKLKQRQQTITELNDELDSLNQEHKRLQQEKKQLETTRQKQIIDFNNVIKEKEDKNIEYTAIIQTDKEHIKRLEEELINRQDQITNFNKIFDQNLLEKQQLNKFNLELTQKYENLFSENQVLKFQFQKQKNDLNDLTNEVKRLKDQYQLQVQNLIIDMKQNQELAKQATDNERAINIQLSKKYEQVFNQNEANKIAIEDSTQQIKSKDQQIILYQTELQNQKNLISNLQGQLQDNLQAFKQRQQQLSDRLSQFMTHNTELQAFNTQLKGDLKELTAKNYEQVQKMREQYQKMLQSNRRLYDDELQLLKKQRENETMQFDNMKNEYEKELQQMMSHQKNELDELDRAFKDQLQQKTRQNFQILQKFTRVNDEFEDFKIKIRMEEMKREAEMQNNKKKRLNKKHRWNTDQIDQQEQEDEDQQMQTVQIQSDQEQPVVPRKLKKKNNSKKKFKPVKAMSKYYQEEDEQKPSEQQSSEPIQIVINSEEEANQQEEQQKSIVDLLKKKKQTQSKPKLKVRRGSELKSQHSRPSQEQEQDEQSMGLTMIRHKTQDIQQQESQVVQQQQQKPKKSKLRRKTSLEYSQHHNSNDNIRQNQGEFDMQEFQRIRQQMQNKIQQLEDEISNLQKNEKKMKTKYQKDEKKYTTQIQQLQTELAQANAQKQQLSNKLSQITKKLKQQARKGGKGREQILQEISKIEMSQPKSPRQPKTPKIPKTSKTPTHSESKIEDRNEKPQKSQKSYRKQSDNEKTDFNQKKYKSKISELQITIEQKQRKISRLQNTIRQLEKQLQQTRKYTSERANLEQSKIIYKTGNDQRSMSFADPELKMSIANLQVKVMSEKQKYHELKLRYEELSRQHNSVVQDFKKARRNMDQLEERDKKRSVSKSMQEIQNQLEDANRRILELSRNFNQIRLEKDSLEDEVRIVRKKLGEVTKTSMEMQNKVSQLERQNDDLKRRELKLKRQIDEWNQQGKRLKENNRNTLQELAETRKNQSEFVLERKKVLDEVIRLQGVVAQKQNELIRNNKQTQRLKARINDGQTSKKQRDRSLNVQLQKLEIERSQLQRKNREYEQTIRILKQKMQFMQKQSKKVLDERKQTYSEKLKQYISEVMSVKKVVEQFQQQNNRLKLQNSQFFGHNEIIKTKYQQLQIKYDELANQQAHLSQQCGKFKQKISQLQQVIKKKQIEDEKNQIVITALRKQLDSERVLSRKKTQKLQSFQQINQRYLYEIKSYKIKLNDYQTNADQTNKLNEQVYMSQKTIDSLQQQLQKISQQYSEHSNKYVYTKEDVEAALKELKEHQNRVKEEEFMKIIQQFEKNNANQRQKMQNELIQLYSENQKLRSSLQKSTQESLQLQLQFAQIESLRDKSRRMQKQRNGLQRKLLQVSDELKISREQVRRIEVKYNDSIRSQQGKSTEYVVLLQKYDDLNKRYQEVSQNYSEIKIQDRKMLDKYKSISQEKQKNIQVLAGELQNLNNKLMGSELEVSRLKDMLAYNNQDYLNKIKSLQIQIEQITQSFKQHDSERQLLHRGQIKEFKIKIGKYQAELQDKLNRIQELNEGVLMLQREVQEITDQLTNARTQLAEQGEYYTIQINKLRNQMRQMEETYRQTIKNLEEELSTMGKQLTSVKFARQANNSRLKMSRVSQGGDDKSNKKYEERLKFKDRRIEELKQTVIALQEKLGEVIRREGKNSELETFRTKYVELQKSQKELIEKKTQELGRANEECKKVKEEVARYKNQIEQLRLLLEEKEMEISSQKAQILTTNRLYSDLQKEVEKRKESLNLQLQQQSSLKMLIQTKDKEIELISRQIEQMNSEIVNYESTIKKKTIENKNLVEINQKLQKDKEKLMSLERNKLEGQNFAKLKIKQAESEIQTLKSQNRRLRNELNFALKENDKIKYQLNSKNANIKQLLRQIEANDKKIIDSQNLLSKFVSLNQESMSKTGVGLQQLIGWSMQTRQSLDLKEEVLTKLNDELQELRFLQQRKLLDYEQLKRQNYELVLKTQEREINYQQLQEMSEKLMEVSRDRQRLLFREEAMKVQLGNICSSLGHQKVFEGGQMRKKIQNVIDGNFM